MSLISNDEKTNIFHVGILSDWAYIPKLYVVVTKHENIKNTYTHTEFF